ERGRVGVDGGGLERQRVPLLPERAVGLAERLAHEEQGLAQPSPGRVLTEVAPQQGGQRVSRMRTTEGQGEIGEERLGFAGGQRDGRARVEPGPEAAEERETEPRHRRKAVSRRPRGRSRQTARWSWPPPRPRSS